MIYDRQIKVSVLISMFLLGMILGNVWGASSIRKTQSNIIKELNERVKYLEKITVVLEPAK